MGAGSNPRATPLRDRYNYMSLGLRVSYFTIAGTSCRVFTLKELPDVGCTRGHVGAKGRPVTIGALGPKSMACAGLGSQDEKVQTAFMPTICGVAVRGMSLP